MFAAHTSNVRHRTPPPLGRRLVAPACALALAVVLTGNVAAAELERDDAGTGVVASGTDARLWLEFKLRTTAGYNVLVFG